MIDTVTIKGQCPKCGCWINEYEEAWQCANCGFIITKQQARECLNAFEFSYLDTMTDAEIFEAWREQWRQAV